MERLRYASTERFYEGVITRVTGGSVTIAIQGRMGELKIPLRMLVSKEKPETGQTVGFLLSCPEVLDEGEKNA
ncbi:MAG: hypothetical protein GX291_05345 [Tissierellia bacterium]|jgi:hypothetical protein|nr:CBO2463/CBO2479 domain-containing protein [Bacillota bacterium]NLK58683.1 hypothetical protein [Tissierellia bacterium]